MTTTARTMNRSDLKYDPADIEPKWQGRWEDSGTYRVDDDDPRPKRYELTMYPYPSGDLHIGHWYAMSGADAHARFMRMRGYNVLHPMGFDAFGLNAENAAIERGIHPAKWTMDNIEKMREQFRSMGPVYDWDRELVTCAPEYYRWNQWIFLKFLEAGLAYRDFAPANWCPTDNTVLANEQVVDGRCERCDSEVVRRELNQWLFRVTEYADELLDHSKIVWPDKINVMQTNWIGRSEGVDIEFDISEYGLEQTSLTTFTTRIDTIFGVTFVVLAPEHPLVDELTMPEQRGEVEAYVDQARRQTEIERLSTEKVKTGVFTGAYAGNRLNGDRVPILIGDYVLLTYGTGIVMGVPAHDQRDFEFAKKYDLPIRVVVAPPDWDGGELTESYVDEGTQASSGRFDGLPSDEGKESIADFIESAGLGQQGRTVPDARLAHLAPAILGHAHTDRLLRRVRHRARSRERAAGAAPGGLRVPPDRRVSAGAARGVREHALPALRQSGQARDRHDGHVRRTRRGTSSGSPVPGRTTRSSTARLSRHGPRSTSTPEASSTRSCTCCTRASSRRRCATSACWTSTSPSSACSIRGTSCPRARR